MSIYKPSLLDKFKDFVNGLRSNWDQYEAHVAEFEAHLADREAHSPGSSILMPLRNGWFAGGVETYGECRCYKDRNRVYFTGLVNPAEATDDMFCQLPEGYRPAYRKVYYAVLAGNPAEFITIYPDGRMVASSRTKGSVYLFGVSFSIN